MSAWKSSKEWVELELRRAGAEVQVRVQGGSRDEQTEPISLGPDFTLESLERFSADVGKAAQGCKPLEGALLERAHALHQALFRGKIQTVWAQLHEAAGSGQVLLRLMLHEPSLQAVPWEAICEPGTTMGFLGNSPDVLPTRGVHSTDPFKVLEVSGAIRVLPIAPSGPAALTTLKQALAERISTGEIEWLEPLTDSRAGWRSLSDRLACEPFPHVIHFIGHGGLEKGIPTLFLGEDDRGEPCWIRVELLAQQLQERLRHHLLLMVLEACEGANPGALASAAELLARAGADAVVAHLWPVKTDVARTSSATFYRELTGKAKRRGDVALALNDARRAVLGEFQCSAEAFSPVLYLRGHDSVLFDFEGRRVSPPRPLSPGAAVDVAPPSPALQRLLEGPFTLLLGDQWKDERLVLEGDFRQHLCEELAKEGEDGDALRWLPLSALTERYVLHWSEERLLWRFQNVFKSVQPASPLLVSLARRLVPGVHITLLRFPMLELVLAEQRPELTLYAIQPPAPGARSDAPATMMRRAAGAEGWEQIADLPRERDRQRELMVLRLYSGFLPERDSGQPLITEDHYLLGIHELNELRPPELTSFIGGELYNQPVLLLGMSLLSWHHRMLLHRLFGRRPLPFGSVVLLEPEAAKKERRLWESGKGLPGGEGGEGVQVVGSGVPELVGSLGTSEEARAP
ncbi:MAG TPA: CHAT domain-containing protein [Archangium sp.]|uniref:CHAT domain-containing protein n=1 Tax=Archangium sp. TaxID=1872627 RepID=UPI002E365ED7|nr:CHAT domain-containing protein [Archangium sp.]HEX5746633.1 CHAT domain-containing protein [Archangium sp.]